MTLSVRTTLAITIISASFATSQSWADGHAEVPTYSAEAEALYMERHSAMFGGSGGQNGGLRYDPLVPVGGADEFGPLPQTDNSQPSTISDDALDAIEAYAAERNSQALMVWRRGKLEREVFFNGADEETLIVGRSLAKPVTVIAIGRAIMKGYIDSLDQPVSDFITEWKGTDRESMLIRHLLDMRTGFLRQGFDPDPASILNRAYIHPHHDEVIIHEYPLTHKPGERYDYSNATSEMVAPVIERATGMEYEDWVAEEVLKPLGAKGGEIWLNRPDGVAHSGCCILLPAGSFFRLGMLSYLDGVWEGTRLLPEGYVEETKTATPQNPWAGMGIYLPGPYIERRGASNPDIEALRVTLHSERYLAEDLYLYDGNANQVVYIVPSDDLIIMRVGNAPPNEKEWDNVFMPNTIIRGIIRALGEQAPTPQS